MMKVAMMRKAEMLNWNMISVLRSQAPEAVDLNAPFNTRTG